MVSESEPNACSARFVWGITRTQNIVESTCGERSVQQTFPKTVGIGRGMDAQVSYFMGDCRRLGIKCLAAEICEGREREIYYGYMLGQGWHPTGQRLTNPIKPAIWDNLPR